MNHTPKNPFCVACAEGKTHHIQARRVSSEHRIDSCSSLENFGASITGDHVISGGDYSKGLNGETAALTLLDLFTYFCMAFPMDAKKRKQH